VDAISKAVNELDLITQYISNVLERLNFANDLNNMGRCYDALLALKPTIRILYAIKQDDEKFTSILDNWIKKINEIKQITNTGSTKARSVFQTGYEKNTKSSSIYEEIETEIWEILGSTGFFTMDIQNYKFFDPSKGKKDLDSWRGKKLD
jgi:hypothetical protein